MSKRRKLRDVLEYESIEDDEAGPSQQQQADAWVADLPSDTLASILLFKGMMTRDKIPTRAIVFKAHVYSVVKNRTTVDRELDQLRLSRQLRMLKIPYDLDDYAVMLWSDYEDTVNEAIASTTTTTTGPTTTAAASSSGSSPSSVPPESGGGRNQRLTTGTSSTSSTQHSTARASPSGRAQPPPSKATLILRHFRDVALPACLDMVVTKDTLGHLLPQAPVDPPPEPATTTTTTTPSLPPPSTPRAVSLAGRATLADYTGQLLAAGFLARDPVRPDTFQFCVPALGSTLQQVRGGREELLSWLRRRRYKEAAEKDVQALRLRSSRLGVAFHIRDLLGTGAVVQLKTTTGAVYKVAVHKG